MKRLLYIALGMMLIVPLLSGCNNTDDDFFSGRVWYITGLCQGKNDNLLMKYDKYGKPADNLSYEWQTNVLKAGVPRYYIEFDENGNFALQTENRTWRGKFTYDLSSHKAKFSFSNSEISSELETRALGFLQDVVNYEGNDRYIKLNCKNGNFIWLDPRPSGGRPLKE